MGRMILPELVIGMAALVICGLVLVGIAAAQGIAGMAAIGRIKEARRTRALERERLAREHAAWEDHTVYISGYAVVRLVKVARWAGNTEVINTDDSDATPIPEEDIEAITRAQIAARLAADRRNALERHGGK